MINFLIWKFKILNWSILRLILLKLSVEILVFPFTWKLDLFTLKRMCVWIQKVMSCKLNCSIKNFNFMAPFSTVSRLQSHAEEIISFLLLISQVSRSCWYSIDPSRKDQRLSWPWSHPVVLKLWPLDWESSALSTRPLHVSSCHHEMYKKFPHISQFGCEMWK